MKKQNAEEREWVRLDYRDEKERAECGRGRSSSHVSKAGMA